MNKPDTPGDAGRGTPAGATAGTPEEPDAPDSTALPENAVGRRRKIFLIGGSILLVLGVAIGIPWYLHARRYVSTDDAFVRAHVTYISPQVAAQVTKVLVLDNQFVKKGTLLITLDRRGYQATVDKIKAQLAAARAAHQASRYALAMTRRTSTAALEEARARVAISQTAIASAQADLAQMKSDRAVTQAQVAAAAANLAGARANVLAARAEAVKAVADYHRYASLLKTGDVTPSQVDTYRAAAISAQARLAAAHKIVLAKEAEVAAAQAAQNAAWQAVFAAQARLQQTRAELGAARAKLAAVNVVPEQVGRKKSGVSGRTAKIAELKAELAQAALNLSYCKIYAPVSGYVTRKSVETGNFVTVGQILMSIVRPNMWVIANFKETDLTYMKPGDPAWITVDAYPALTYKGYVQSIQAGTGAEFSLLPPENATGNYVQVVQRVPVKILFKDLPKKMPYLAAGMSAVPVVKVR